MKLSFAKRVWAVLLALMLAVSAPVLAIAEPVVETVETAAPTEAPEETEAPAVEEAPIETEEPVAETEEPAETEQPAVNDQPVELRPVDNLPIGELPTIGEITPNDTADDKPAKPNLSALTPKSQQTSKAIRVHDSSQDIPKYAKNYSRITYFKYLAAGTYTLSDVYEENGAFWCLLTITDLEYYVKDFNDNYPAKENPFVIDKTKTTSDFTWKLKYVGSAPNYKTDGSGWTVDSSSWAKGENKTGKVLYVTRVPLTATYTVTYTDGVEGEEVFADQVYTVTSGDPTPRFNGTPTREGYTFLGWNPAVAATVSDNATYTAQWEATVQKYRLTFNGNGANKLSGTISGNYTSKTKYPADAEVNLLSAMDGKKFTRELSSDYTTNYRQTGWNTRKDGTGEHYAMNDTFVMPAADATLYAEWESYEWIHWNAVLGEGGKEIAYSINNVKQAPVQTFKLYTGNVGTGAGKVPAAYYTPVVATAEDGYYCIGWYDVNKDALVSAKDTLFVQDFRNLRALKMAETGARLEARFAKYLTVTYTDGVDGEEVFADQTHTGLKAGDATPPFDGELSREGYVFDGWEPVVTDVVTADTTYTATWAEDKNGNGKPDKEEEHFTVTYTDGVDGEEVFADQVYGNQLVDMPTPKFDGELTREGYVFDGWEPAVAETVTENATYTATWAEDKNGNGKADKEEPHFTVTYTDGVDGEEVFADQVTTDQLVDMPTPKFDGEITRKGYVFKGWEPAVAETVTADATYTATWAADRNNNGVDDAEEEHFTVTYTDGVEKTEVFADQVTTDLIAGDATPAFNGTPTRKGYKFKGWEPAVSETVTGNATYTAKWTKVAASDDEDVPKTGDFASAPAALLASSVAFLGLGAFLTAESRKAKKNH